MSEILFSHNNTRCHATIITEELIKSNAFVTEAINTPERYVGSLNGYSIYSLSNIFDQFGFVAIEEN